MPSTSQCTISGRFCQGVIFLKKPLDKVSGVWYYVSVGNDTTHQEKEQQ